MTAPETPLTWAEYLRSRLSRPGWTVARLAREARMDPSAIFKWLRGGTRTVQVESVLAVAKAFGDEPEVALAAAGGVQARAALHVAQPVVDHHDHSPAAASAEDDPELKLILQSSASSAEKVRLIEMLLAIRDKQRQREAELRQAVNELRQPRPQNDAGGDDVD